MRKLWKVAQTAHQRLGTLNIRERKHVLELLDIRAAVVAQPTRSSPAQIEITGTVTETIGEALGGDLSDVAPRLLFPNFPTVFGDGDRSRPNKLVITDTLEVEFDQVE